MSAGASVEGRERVRLFVALLLPRDAAERLVRWQREQLPGSEGIRVVGAESLHLTLAFLGSRPASDVPAIAAAVRDAAADAGPIVLSPKGYRETRSVGMVVLDDRGGHADRLAERVWHALEQLGVYERERRPWLPHVTVLRFRAPPRAAPSLPELGEVRPSEVALYHSLLRPGGAQYQVLESVRLGG